MYWHQGKVLLEYIYDKRNASNILFNTLFVIYTSPLVRIIEDYKMKIGAIKEYVGSIPLLFRWTGFSNSSFIRLQKRSREDLLQLFPYLECFRVHS